MIAALERVFREERETTLLGLLRVAMGGLLLTNGIRLAQELSAGGFFGDFWHWPLIDEAWVPNERVYAVLLALKIAGAVLAIIGVVPRAGLLSSALIGLYFLACDRLQYHNNRYATHLLALLLAFTPCDRSFLFVRRIFGRKSPASAGPYWAVRLMQIQVSLLYLVSGGGKLFDPDWRSGQVMFIRFGNGIKQALAQGLPVPAAIVDLCVSPAFANVASKFAIGTELFLGIGLWLPRTRAFALWLGVLFHLGIQATANIDLFSWLMLSSYLLFVTPELRQRVLVYDERSKSGRIVAHSLRFFDWLLRFRVERAKSDTKSESFSIADRDGSSYEGRRAFVGLCRTIVVLFPLWLPVAAAARLSLRSRHAEPRSSP